MTCTICMREWMPRLHEFHSWLKRKIANDICIYVCMYVLLDGLVVLISRLVKKIRLHITCTIYVLVEGPVV